MGLTTEARNPRTMDLDALDTDAILHRINKEDARVAGAIRAVIPDIAKAVSLVTTCMRRGGRLIYIGAGTSGRLGVLDAAECPPTFGTDPGRIRGLIAGGSGALVRAVEGAEDREGEGEGEIDDLAVGSVDVVMGIAASWRTPYTVAAVKRAKARGASTIYLTTNAPEKVELKVDVLIAPQVGPEAIMGSTRMKSGTAQKLILNMITSTTMIRLGKVHENMMVDLMATSEKLRERSKRVVMTATGIDYTDAEQLLSAAGGSVKRAIVMSLADAGFEAADRALVNAGGRVREALQSLGVGEVGAEGGGEGTPRDDRRAGDPSAGDATAGAKEGDRV